MSKKKPLSFRWKYLGLSVGIVLAYLIFYLFPDFSFRSLSCPFKVLTGIPCPACGTTRASLELLQGEWKAALYTNPLVVLTHGLIVGSLLWMLGDVWRGKETFLPAMRKSWKLCYLLPLLALLGLNMWWNYQKGL